MVSFNKLYEKGGRKEGRREEEKEGEGKRQEIVPSQNPD